MPSLRHRSVTWNGVGSSQGTGRHLFLHLVRAWIGLSLCPSVQPCPSSVPPVPSCAGRRTPHCDFFLNFPRRPWSGASSRSVGRSHRVDLASACSSSAAILSLSHVHDPSEVSESSCVFSSLSSFSSFILTRINGLLQSNMQAKNNENCCSAVFSGGIILLIFIK